MKLVKFGENKYGIRMGFLKHKYVDLKTPYFNWSMDSRHYQDCIGTLEEVRKVWFMFHPIVCDEKVLYEVPSAL